MFDSALLLRATDENRAFWCVCCFVCLFFGGNAVLYHGTDNASLTRLPGFLGTYEEPLQDVTVSAAQASLGHRALPSPHITT